jgi:hypothetical protein
MGWRRAGLFNALVFGSLGEVSLKSHMLMQTVL